MSSSLGEKIRELRLKKGLSLEKLGELTDTSKSYIWELENRKSANPTADKLAKISYALGVTTDYLTNDEVKLSTNILQEAFFRKFKLLSESDQKKMVQLVDLWSKPE